MKTPITHNVSCIGVLVLLASYGNSPAAAAPTPKSPITHTVPAAATRTLVSLAKPVPGSQLNPTNALSRGLVSLVALNEGSGTAFYDAATKLTYHAVKLSGTPAGALPPTW